MIYKTYAVFDSKIGTYARPFQMQTSGEALRSWMDIVNDEKTQFYKHPEDFTLFELGSYNDDTGKFENHPTPVSIATAISVIRTSDAERAVDGTFKSIMHPRGSHNNNEVTRQ